MQYGDTKIINGQLMTLTPVGFRPVQGSANTLSKMPSIGGLQNDQMSIGGIGGGQDFDPSGLQAQIDANKNLLSNLSTFDPSNLQSQIGSLQDKISGFSQFDPSGLQEQIQANRQLLSNIPQFDPSELQSGIAGLSERISNIPQFDPSNLQSQIGGIEERLANIPQFDPSSLQQQIQANRDLLSNIPQFDPSSLQSGIAGLRDRLDNLNIPEYEAPDLSGFARLEDLPQIDTSKFLTAADLPKFDPKDFREDFLSIAREGIQLPEYQAPDLSGFVRKEDIPTFDKEAFEKEILGKMQGSLQIPQFDRDALIADVRSGLNIPKPPSFDREKLIEDIRSGINIPKFDRESLIKDIRSELPTPPAFDRQKLIEDIRAGIDIPQPSNPFDPSNLQKRLTALESRNIPAFDPTGLQNRLQELEQRLSELQTTAQPQPSPLENDYTLPEPQPIDNNASLDVFGNVGGANLVRDPYGNMVDPNNLPDNMKLETGPRGTTVRFADDYALQPGDPGYQTNDSDRFNRNIQPIRNDSIDNNASLDVFGNVGGAGGLTRPPQLPPKRDDFISIGGPGGGAPDPRTNMNIETRDTDFGQVTTSSPALPGQDPVTTAPTPSAADGQVQTQPMPVGALDPVLLGQTSQETLTDPLVRGLYFGTADQPGFYQQLQQAGANLIGQDVPLQQTAGLSPLELLAREKAVAGLGGFEPFLARNRELVDQAIQESRRAEEIGDPYYTQAEEIFKQTMGGYDPSMTQQFYNPYEDAVVQKTISDVMEAGEKQDIASRAREISAGAFGGSRARLGAMERQEALGEGLAGALGAIRQRGFSEAQRTGLSEFAREMEAKRTGARGLMGIGAGRSGAARGLGTDLARYGSQIGGIGSTQEGLRAGQRGELAGYGSIGRGIAETGLGRIFERDIRQQERPLGVLGQIGSMLPGYQQGSTQIGSQYGLPTDPSAAGLGAAFSAYGALAPRQGQG